MNGQILTLRLGADVVYVTGSVNGVTTVWTNIYENVWQTEADRAGDDIYRVEIESITSSGAVTHHSLVLYLGLHLITDRVQADADRVRYLVNRCYTGQATDSEKAELVNSPKGAYMASDLNRVGQAVNYVAQLLTEASYTYRPAMKVDWTNDDYFKPPDMTSYLAKVETLRSTLAVLPDTPVTPPDVADWRQANDVEKIIEDVFRLYQNMVSSWYYLGDLYLGEV